MKFKEALNILNLEKQARKRAIWYPEDDEPMEVEVGNSWESVKDYHTGEMTRTYQVFDPETGEKYVTDEEHLDFLDEESEEDEVARRWGR